MNTLDYLEEFSNFNYRWGDLERIIFLMIQCGITSEQEITLCFAKNFNEEYTARQIYFAFERVTNTILLGCNNDKQ